MPVYKYVEILVIMAYKNIFSVLAGGFIQIAGRRAFHKAIVKGFLIKEY